MSVRDAFRMKWRERYTQIEHEIRLMNEEEFVKHLRIDSPDRNKVFLLTGIAYSSENAETSRYAFALLEELRDSVIEKPSKRSDPFLFFVGALSALFGVASFSYFRNKS